MRRHIKKWERATFLNLFADYIHKNDNLETAPPHEPFEAKQSDDMVTNGIDYYKISDFMLLDVQGMALQDCKT